MDEPYDQVGAFANDVDPSVLDPAKGADHNVRPDRLLLEQIVEKLDSLQQEYGQIRRWLEGVHQQLVRREARVSQRLQDAIALTNQLHHRSTDNDLELAPGNSNPPLTLHVQTLGRFQVLYSNREVSLGPSKRGRTIFRYLVTRPERRVARDVLLELFWTGEPSQKANHKLHIAISTLRGALNEALEIHPEGAPPQSGSDVACEESLLFEEDHYFIHPAIHVSLDAEAFASRVQAGERLEREGRSAEAFAQYGAARSLYRGDFLTEDLYADWAIAPRARLEEMYLALLGRLAQHDLEHGRFVQCITCCRQILAKDSFREDAYRQLMCCYSRMGQRNQALRAFHSCEQVLEQELGVRPMKETVDLYERIVRQEPV